MGVSIKLAAGLAAAFIAACSPPPANAPKSAAQAAAPTKSAASASAPPEAKTPPRVQVNPHAARLLFNQYGDQLYGLYAQAMSADTEALASRHPVSGHAYPQRDLITCRDGLIAADMVQNIMAVTYAYNILASNQIGPYAGAELMAPYYQFGEDLDYLGRQISQLRVVCKNILPGVGYVPEYDVMNNSGQEVRAITSTALEEMGFHLGDLGDRMIEKPGTITLSDSQFCKPLHDVAAALRITMRDQPAPHATSDHAANFDEFYRNLKSLCPQYGPIY
jgi:hypothetical protein